MPSSSQLSSLNYQPRPRRCPTLPLRSRLWRFVPILCVPGALGGRYELRVPSFAKASVARRFDGATRWRSVMAQRRGCSNLCPAGTPGTTPGDGCAPQKRAVGRLAPLAEIGRRISLSQLLAAEASCVGGVIFQPSTAAMKLFSALHERVCSPKPRRRYELRVERSWLRRSDMILLPTRTDCRSHPLVEAGLMLRWTFRFARLRRRRKARCR